MTPAEAQVIPDEAVRLDQWVMWFVTVEVGQAVATARRADPSGGTVLGQLVADTLDELRAMLPAGLVRPDATAMMQADVVETWD